MSNNQQGLNKLFVTIVGALVIIGVIALLRFIIDAINKNRPPCLEGNKFIRNVCKDKNETITLGAKSEDNAVDATVMLSADDSMITYSINVYKSCNPKLENLREVILELPNDTGNNVRYESKKLEDIIETEDGYVINGMWMHSEEDPISKFLAAKIRNNELVVTLLFENVKLSGKLINCNLGGGKLSVN